MKPVLDEFTLAQASHANVSELAMLHEQLLQGELTALGREAIGLVYAAILEQKIATVNTVQRDGDCVGFVMTALDERDVVKNAIRTQRLQVALAANKFALVRAALSSVVQSQAENIGPTLMYIAVREDQRGTGCSALLIEAADRQFRADGVSEYALRVNAANPGALNFYFKMGFRAAGFEARWGQLILRKAI